MHLVQERTEYLCEPCIEEGGLLVPVKRNGAVKVVPIRAAIHEGPGSMIAGPQPGHPLAFGACV